MKKLVVLIVLIMSMSIMAEAQEVYKFRTSAFAIAKFDSYANTWGAFTSWTSTNVLVVIDASNDRVTIYSATTQVYDITEMLSNTKDNSGDQTMKWQCVDNTGTRCVLRIMLRGINNAQMYIDYTNVCWVYNLVSI